ncbi:hypothetical protein BLA29_011348, partial [Euroglyphus maynei]
MAVKQPQCNNERNIFICIPAINERVVPIRSENNSLNACDMDKCLVPIGCICIRVRITFNGYINVDIVPPNNAPV